MGCTAREHCTVIGSATWGFRPEIARGETERESERIATSSRARPARAIIGGVAAAIVFALLFVLKGALTPLAAAFVIAYLLDPLIDRFEARRVRRSLAIFVLLALRGGVVAGSRALRAAETPAGTGRARRADADLPRPAHDGRDPADRAALRHPASAHLRRRVRAGEARRDPAAARFDARAADPHARDRHRHARLAGRAAA